ncbi:MAG: hypothetical protein U1F16_02090 [Turneriella sp.]
MKNDTADYTLPQQLIERAYSRAAQGRILSMYYNAMVPDAANFGHELGSDSREPRRPIRRQTLLQGEEVLLASGRGATPTHRQNSFPPRHLTGPPTVITDNRVQNGSLVKDAAFDQSVNEVTLQSDAGKTAGAGSRTHCLRRRRCRRERVDPALRSHCE